MEEPPCEGRKGRKGGKGGREGERKEKKGKQLLSTCLPRQLLEVS